VQVAERVEAQLIRRRRRNYESARAWRAAHPTNRTGYALLYLACTGAHLVDIPVMPHARISRCIAQAQCTVSSSITETNRTHLVLFGMQNRTLGPYLAAIDMIVISVMESAGQHSTHRPPSKKAKVQQHSRPFICITHHTSGHHATSHRPPTSPPTHPHACTHTHPSQKRASVTTFSQCQSQDCQSGLTLDFSSPSNSMPTDPKPSTLNPSKHAPVSRIM
jgi:hypothetical protein